MQARAVLVLKAQQHDARIWQAVVSSPVLPQHSEQGVPHAGAAALAAAAPGSATNRSVFSRFNSVEAMK
jgi:hypothetical protein